MRRRQGVPDKDHRQNPSPSPSTVARVDGQEIRDKATALAAIGTALDFPKYYGQNLDALFDCLTDLSWLPPGEVRLIWTNVGTLQKADASAYRAVVKVLHDAEEVVPRTSPEHQFTVDLCHWSLPGGE